MAKIPTGTAGSSPLANTSLPCSPKASSQQGVPASTRIRPLSAAALVICLLVIGGAGWFIIYPELAGIYHWRKARQALDQYDFGQARIHLRDCLEIWPKSGETSFLMARTCRRAGDFDSARTHLQEAERKGWVPALIDLERLLAKAQAGLVQAVEQDLRRHLEARPAEQKVILETLVIGSLQSNFLDDAYRWSTRWVEDYPDDWQGHFVRGRVLESGLRFDLAADEYQRALEDKPDLLPARLRLGEMLLRQGQYALAVPHFQTCLRSDPHDDTALLSLARCQRYLSPPEVAWATLDQLSAGKEQHAGELLLRGQLELERGHADKALVWLQRAERRSPQDVDTYQALATALRLLNRADEAQTYERKRQMIESDLRRMEELTKEIIHSPRDATLRSEAGITLLRLGQPEQAARWLVSALLIDPHHQPAKKALTACLPGLGDPKLVEHYRHILEES
jgi:tetratricopeptide (TPR) repeat protein